MLRPMNVLITGTNRGLGLELVKQFLQLPKPPKHLLATCRNPQNAEELNDIARKHSNVTVLKLDITELDSFERIAELVEIYTEGEGLNLLINNAAINVPQGLEEISSDVMIQTYVTNVVGPVQLTRALLPYLRIAAKASPDLRVGCNRAAVVNVSTRNASIELNTGGQYPYRASEAALNMVTKSMNLELKADGILCFCIHPGWVLTEMGGPQALITMETSVAGLLKVMSKMEEDSDIFVKYTGKKLPW